MRAWFVVFLVASLALALALALACGCSDRSTQEKPTGSEGGPCYGDGTCDHGWLECLSNLCERIPDAMADGFAMHHGDDNFIPHDLSVPDAPVPDSWWNHGVDDVIHPHDLSVPDAAVPDAAALDSSND